MIVSLPRSLVYNLIATLLLIVPLTAQIVSDPLPYAPIANPLPDTLNQLKRDSLNLKISRVRVNQAGYRVGDAKYFYYIATTAPSTYRAIDLATGTIAATGALVSTGATSSGQLHIRASNNAQLMGGGDTRYIMDSQIIDGTVYEGKLPALPVGRYRVVVASDTSAKFVVDDRIYSWVKDAVLKFFGINRCGPSNSWFHKDCHVQDGVTGGWHDCGDHLKEAQTQSFALAMLGLTAAALKDRDADHYGRNQANTVLTDGVPDILYEARLGAEFVINSYAAAGQVVSAMNTSVGNFGMDHSWWGRPEYQDLMPTDRGGPLRELRNEVGANVCGRFAAGMAFTAKLYEPYDAAFSTKALSIAKALYAYGKAHQTASSSSAYSGESSIYDDMGLAAIALLWATRDTMYKFDLLYNTAIGNKANAAFPKGTFAGGWFAYDNPGPQHGMANTSWASMQTPALWGLYKMILRDKAVATSVGISEAERLKLIESVIYAIIVNIGDVGAGDASITLPASSLGWKKNTVTYEKIWKTMYTEQEWVWNRYQSGNICELYCYYDMAREIQGMALPGTPASTDWKADSVKEVLVRQLDYQLGMNPWDLSMIYGVGAKSFNHPHHRAANPEGKNVPGAFYKYIQPAGGLHGGQKPTTALYSEHYDDYRHSETGIDGVGVLILPLCGLSATLPLDQPPEATVRVVYVGSDKAIIEVRQSRYGPASVRYGVAPLAPTRNQPSDSNSVFHTIILNSLTSGTTYNFDVVVSDLLGNDTTITNKGQYFTFTTLSNPPGPATIANVKVCRVTADSAEIFWYTPNGEYDSKVVYGTVRPPVTVKEGDVAGHPTKFHYVKIGGLAEKTTYYFYVESNGVRNDNAGLYYTFTTPVTHVKFDIRALTYDFGGIPFLGLDLINQDTKSYDSLDIRVYLRATEDAMKDFAAAVDIGIKYTPAGFQGTHFKGEIDPLIQKQHPQKMADTYDPATNTYAWYLSLPLGSVIMESGSRFRLDIGFRKRNLPYNEDLLYLPATHIPGSADWSWAAHSRQSGAPADFGGIKPGNKDDLDNNYWNLEANPYIGVYRKGEFVYGYSPSAAEQRTKRTYYEMTSQITEPLENPSQEYVTLERSVNSITVRGYASVTEAGIINDIWVNGLRIANVNNVVTYDRLRDRFTFAIAVPMKNGGNEVDITIFAGPEQQCTECYGCAFQNHHFYVEFSGAQQYPSTLRLLNVQGGPLLSRQAKIDTTQFLVAVVDKNGNVAKDKRDTVYVQVYNPLLGDSAQVPLVETGLSTDTFVVAFPMSVVNKQPAQTSTYEIGMSEGDKIYIAYTDPSDSTDRHVDSLFSPATYPVPINGWYLDASGDGAVDKAVVVYDKTLRFAPDSVELWFPDLGQTRLVRAADITISGTTATITIRTPFALATTAFTGTATNSGKSYLTENGRGTPKYFNLADSVGAVLKSGVIVEQGSTTTSRTLFITLSEGIDAATLTGVTLTLSRPGSPPSTLTVSTITAGTNGSSTFTVVVSGPVLPAVGDSLRLTAGATGITDLFGNRPHSANPAIILGFKPAPPRLLFAAYFDTDADGFVDTVSLRFTKKVYPADLTVLFDWGGIRRTGQLGARAMNYLGSDSTALRIAVRGAFPPDSLARTDGMMFVSVTYLSFPGDKSDTLVSDSAAPVITRAEYRPGITARIGSALADTLIVTFSEGVTIRDRTEPFKLSSPTTGGYTITLQVLSLTDKTALFLVTSLQGSVFPRSGDSIWINPTATVADSGLSVQLNAANRRASLFVKSVRYPWVMAITENPFVAAPGGSGTAVTLAADGGASILTGMSATIRIYDALGNRVVDERHFVLDNGVLSVRWDGRNRNNRYVGTGTYVGVILVTEGDGGQTVKKIKIGVRR